MIKLIKSHSLKTIIYFQDVQISVRNLNTISYDKDALISI
jgi:hypothetical protein